MKQIMYPFLHSGLGSAAENAACISSPLIKEKLVPVIVELFLEAPTVEKYNAIPEIIQGLGR